MDWITEPTCMKCGRLKKYPTGQTTIGIIKICNCDEIRNMKEEGNK